MEHTHLKHFYDVDIAKKYGILEAVMLESIRYWLIRNEATETNFHEGKYWTYNSVKAFNELFPEATEKQIRRVLDKLREENLLITANFNKESWDRSLWYTLTEKGWNIFGDYEKNGQMHLPKWANGLAQMGEPIPDIYTNIREIENYNNARARGNVTKSSETVTKFSFDDCVKFFEENFGELTPYKRNVLSQLNEQYGSDILHKAMADSCELGGQSISYIKKNLLRYHTPKK